MQVAEVIRDLACQLQAFIRNLAGAHSLSPTQAQILFTIPTDGLSMSALAKRLGLDASTMTRIIANMVLQGWVQQTPDTRDRRVTLVRLTTEGENLYRELLDELEAQLALVLKGLDADGQELLLAPLEDLAWRLMKARL